MFMFKNNKTIVRQIMNTNKRFFSVNPLIDKPVTSQIDKPNEQPIDPRIITYCEENNKLVVDLSKRVYTLEIYCLALCAFGGGFGIGTFAYNFFK